MSPIQSHPGQLSLWNDPARFQVIVAGRRFGKTIYLRERMLQASEKPGAEIVYFAPTRSQAEDILWKSLKNRIDELGWSVVTHETKLRITRGNDATIQLMSAEKPGRLRGRGLDLLALDEYGEYRSDEIWAQVGRPALSDKRGRAIFAGTPKGFNHLYDLNNNAKLEFNWSAHSFKTLDSPFFQTPQGRAEIEEARKNLLERDFRQEYEASFENFAGRVYYAFDRELHHCEAEYNEHLPIVVGQDFNKTPMTATLHQRHGGEFVQFGEVYLAASDTPEMCRTIRQQYPNAKIVSRPDATGKRSYSVDKNLSDHYILEEHGFEIDCEAINPSRVDRWASVNRAFEKGLSRVNVKNCPKTAKDLEVICFKEGTCEPDLKDKMLGHISDAHGYAVHKEFPIMGEVIVT